MPTGRDPFVPWQYLPVTEIGARPHVVVDGAARPGTVGTLSHWPGTPTPRRLWADTSAEIVLRALRRPRLLPADVRLATVDHYDADGMIALGLLVVEGLAERHGPLMATAARAGDFDVIHSRPAALVAFALGALGPGGAAASDDQAVTADGAVDATALSARRALEVLPALADRPAAFEELWGPEAAAYDAACALLHGGVVVIEEDRARDLAVARIEEDAVGDTARGWAGSIVHRAALHSATTCLRVAQVVGRRYRLHYRYESWVRLGRRRPRPRVDLTPLAAALTEAETDGGQWRFDGAGAITPHLGRVDGGPSTLSPDRWLAEVRSAFDTLDRLPPAWDPYAAPAADAPSIAG